MGRAIGYIRVSTEEQVKEGVSLAAQKDRVTAYAVAKDLDLVEVVADEGLSGKNLKRPGLEKVLGMCHGGEVDNVIVWRLDRLTRRTRDLLSLVEDVFLARGVELHSVVESLDTSSPHGRFVLTLLGGLAQMERELIGDRTRAALAYKRERMQPTSHPPLGFTSKGANQPMTADPGELSTVRRILASHESGKSLAAIARQLNASRTPTKRGGRWFASTVSNVVRRADWYAGSSSRSVHVRTGV